MPQQDFYIEQATVEIGVGFKTEPESFASLSVHATGIYVGRANRTYLITNWHVVTGRSPETGNPMQGIPNRPEYLIIKESVGGKERYLPLYTPENEKRFSETLNRVEVEGHPHIVDVVAIPAETDLVPIPLDVCLQPAYQLLEPAQDLIVLGYPYHRDRCIWKTCHIAESIQSYFDYFLINGRTKPGMSGSGVFQLAYSTPHGRVLVGIYSGRYNDLGVHEKLNDLDIGIVWKLDVLDRLIPLSFHSGHESHGPLSA